MIYTNSDFTWVYNPNDIKLTNVTVSDNTFIGGSLNFPVPATHEDDAIAWLRNRVKEITDLVPV